MELEKEVRFLVGDDIWNKAQEITKSFKDKVEMLDITMGAYGRESVAKTGKVFRIRKKTNKITLEIKNRIADGWQEEAIVLDSVTRAISVLTLAGLKPYLYIARTREVKKFKGLKIFFDDVELLGKYIEVEYQDSEDAMAELQEFCSLCGIESDGQPMYGEIINIKYEEDIEFRKAFDNKLKLLINEHI